MVVINNQWSDTAGCEYGLESSNDTWERCENCFVALNKLKICLQVQRRLCSFYNNIKTVDLAENILSVDHL